MGQTFWAFAIATAVLAALCWYLLGADEYADRKIAVIACCGILILGLLFGWLLDKAERQPKPAPTPVYVIIVTPTPDIKPQ